MRRILSLSLIALIAAACSFYTPQDQPMVVLRSVISKTGLIQTAAMQPTESNPMVEASFDNVGQVLIIDRADGTTRRLNRRAMTHHCDFQTRVIVDPANPELENAAVTQDQTTDRFRTTAAAVAYRNNGFARPEASALVAVDKPVLPKPGSAFRGYYIGHISFADNGVVQSKNITGFMGFRVTQDGLGLTVLGGAPTQVPCAGNNGFSTAMLGNGFLGGRKSIPPMNIFPGAMPYPNHYKSLLLNGGSIAGAINGSGRVDLSHNFPGPASGLILQSGYDYFADPANFDPAGDPNDPSNEMQTMPLETIRFHGQFYEAEGGRVGFIGSVLMSGTTVSGDAIANCFRAPDISAGGCWMESGVFLLRQF